MILPARRPRIRRVPISPPRALEPPPLPTNVTLEQPVAPPMSGVRLRAEHADDDYEEVEDFEAID